MDEFTFFGCAVAAGGAVLLYLKLVSRAIEGVEHTLVLLDQSERSALRRRNTEKEQSNPTATAVAIPLGAEGV